MACVYACFTHKADLDRFEAERAAQPPGLHILDGFRSRCTSPRCTSPAGRPIVAWTDILTPGVVARVLACLPFRDRLQAASVCRSWRAIVSSAAAHCEEMQCADRNCSTWGTAVMQSCDVHAAEEEQQYKLHLCKSLRFASSASVWRCAVGDTTLRQLRNLTRLQLLDIKCDVDGRQFSPPVRPIASLQHLTKLRILSLGMSSTLVDFKQLPCSLECLQMNLASGYSVQQLQCLCATLADSSKQLPHLQHISLAMELDTLLSEGQKTVLNPLGRLTQLTSLSITSYQLLPPDSPAHEGYSVVPSVLSQLTDLQQVELHISSGQNAQLEGAAGVPDVQLILTLARHEQSPFSRLPPSLVTLTGLSSLSILSAEFAYEEDTDLYVFDAGALALCPQLHTLLLELHGAKCSQHDLRGLAQLKHLKDLVVFFKCPDVHEARPEAASYASSSSGSESTRCASTDGSVAAMGLRNCMARTAAAVKKKPSAKGVRSLLARAVAGSSRGSGSALTDAIGATDQARAKSNSANAELLGSSNHSRHSCKGDDLCEEWVLQVLDTALDQLRPEFALSVPRVSGRMLIATTSRLLLRQPDLVTAAGSPMLMASHLQLDCDSIGDCWGGQCFLHRLSPGALRAWASRHWQPCGVDMLPAARYHQLRYPGCKQQMSDKLLVVARRGVLGQQVVQCIKEVAETRCFAFFT